MKKNARKASQKAEVKSTKVAAASAPKRASKIQPAASEILNLEQIKDLIELIAEKQFTDFELERGQFRMRLGRGGAARTAYESLHHPSVLPDAAPALGVAHAAPAPVIQVAPAPVEEDLHIITSPIVGTFYRASSPTTAPFVNVGDSIATGKTLCIIEAMKLMNEIQSDISGTVAKVFIENAQPVEYGQPLFGIKI
jgi:acetyl-CoA carboxylase biotin carboxyl carrier protein